MSIFSYLMAGFQNKKKSISPTDDNRRLYILYKIVNANKLEDKFTLQCINNRAEFQITLNELVFEDIAILYGLHPVQACYIGIVYAAYLQRNEPSTYRNKQRMDKHTVCRYGKYYITHQDRKGNIGFSSNETKEKFLMDPSSIARTKDLIENFDASQAFRIGFLAESKINNPPVKPDKKSKPYLRLVK